MYMNKIKTLPKRKGTWYLAIAHVFPDILSYMNKNYQLSPSLEEIASWYGRTRAWAAIVVKILIKEKLLTKKSGIYRSLRPVNGWEEKLKKLMSQT